MKKISFPILLPVLLLAACEEPALPEPSSLTFDLAANSGTMTLVSEAVVPLHEVAEWGPDGSVVSYYHPDIPVPAGEFDIDFEVRGLIRYRRTYNPSVIVEEFGPGGATYTGTAAWLRPGEGAVGITWHTSSGQLAGWIWPSAADRGPGPSFQGRIRVRGPGVLRLGRAFLSTGAGTSAFVEGEQVFSVRATPVSQAAIQLSCIGDLGQNRATRGKEIVCTAKKNPADAAGELHVVQWSFGGRRRADGELTSTTWRGIMAESGEVVLQARIGTGSVVTERARVTVEARGWTDHLPPVRFDPLSCEVRTPTCPQTRMVEERDAGLSFLPMSEIDLSRLRPDWIGEGPNTGLWYVAGDESPVRLPAPITRLNPGVFDPGNRLYFSQRTCRPEDVQYWITAHENVHITIGQERASNGYINRALERETFYAAADDSRFWGRVQRVLRSRLVNLLDGEHAEKNKYPSPPCDLPLRANTQP